MLVVAVLPDAFRHALEKGWYGVSVPFFEAVAVRGQRDEAALVGEDADFVDEVGVLGPAGWDHAGVGVPDVFVVEPGDDGFVPSPDITAQVGVGAGGDVPGSG
jgi:hypothetical protein